MTEARLDVTDEVLPLGNTPDSSFTAGGSPPGMSLPPFTSAADPVFTWGEHDATLFIESLTTTYLEAIHWKFNLFKIPYGGVGKSFVTELARLFRTFAEASALEAVALKAATIMPILLLQKPAKKSTAKDHTKCLQRRLNTWREGDLMELRTAMYSSPRKGLPKGILWPCQCMPSQQYRLLLR